MSEVNPTTREEIVAEILKCAKQPAYFLTNHAFIQHPTKGLIPFRLFPFQEDLVQGFVQHRKNIVLKARQLGATTVVAGYIAWLVLLHRDKNVLILATKQKTAQNMIRVVKNIVKNLPKWMKQMGKIKIDNRQSIELANGSRVTALATSSDTGRSEAVSLLVCDECAFIPNFTEIWTGVSPTVSAGGSVILLSTPNGTGNKFHELYEGAQLDTNGFNCKYGTYINPHDPTEIYNDRFMWWVHPQYDLEWFANETRDKNQRQIAQEYCCAYNASGETFLMPEELDALRKRGRDPISVHSIDRHIWIWKQPERNGTYIIASDVSRGDAADYSAFHVLRIDQDKIEQVCEYKGKIKPDQLGTLLMQVSKMYNDATVAPENNNGWAGQTIAVMEQAAFPHIYYSRKRKPKEKDGFVVDAQYAMYRNDYAPGYAVTSANRNQMLAKVEQYIRNGDVVLYSKRLISEFETFIVTEFNRPEAQRGKSDDLVMALAGALWIHDESFKRSYRNDEVTMAMLSAISVNTTTTHNIPQFNQFNTLINEKEKAIVDYDASTNKAKTNSGDTWDFAWLITKG